MAKSKFSTWTAWVINFPKLKDTCEVIIPNPSGNAGAIIKMKREHIAQEMEDKPDVLEVNFTLRLTEEQMLEISRQWKENDSVAEKQ